MTLTKLSTAFKSKALIPYITLGDPSVSDTLRYCKSMIDAGASIIEIGIPFSDPIADGPVIQASHQRALDNQDDVSLEAAFTLTTKLKAYAPQVPIVFMAATNLILQYGYKTFFKRADSIGCDGLIMPDCSIEMAADVVAIAKNHHCDLIQLISPLCTQERVRRIVQSAQGFIYLISSTGITGERNAFSEVLHKLVQDIKSIKSIPVAVGFGISKPEHCQEMYKFADGVIVGSHFTRLISESLEANKDANKVLQDAVRTLAKAHV